MGDSIENALHGMPKQRSPTSSNVASLSDGRFKDDSRASRKTVLGNITEVETRGMPGPGLDWTMVEDLCLNVEGRRGNDRWPTLSGCIVAHCIIITVLLSLSVSPGARHALLRLSNHGVVNAAKPSRNTGSCETRSNL